MYILQKGNDKKILNLQSYTSNKSLYKKYCKKYHLTFSMYNVKTYTMASTWIFQYTRKIKTT